MIHGPTHDDMARTWIAYHVWSIGRPDRGDLTDAEADQEDAEADGHGWWAWERVSEIVRDDPERAWSMILRLVELSPDDLILANVAAGPLEDLLREHPYVIDRVELRAGVDARFRRCLSGIWGWYSIPDDVQARMRRTWEGEDAL
jgi:hypothetical protein